HLSTELCALPQVSRWLLAPDLGHDCAAYAGTGEPERTRRTAAAEVFQPIGPRIRIATFCAPFHLAGRGGRRVTPDSAALSGLKAGVHRSVLLPIFGPPVDEVSRDCRARDLDREWDRPLRALSFG